MKWLTEADLKTWSKRTDSRELFIDLVADLIRATIGNPKSFRFPGQGAGTLPGFDGRLETTEAVSRIPEGRSLWEFGTSEGTKAKADADYNKRTINSRLSADVMKQSSLVLINLHSWVTPMESLEVWLAERNAEGKWKEVLYIDGTSLVSWLEEQPAVAAKYARNVLRNHPKNGALSTDEFWEQYSNSFKPALTEKMLLCERESVAEQLLKVLTGPPQTITIGADSEEEAIAFAVAAIRSTSDESRVYLENKIMVVESYDAAQFFLGTDGLSFLVRKEAKELAGSLSLKGPTLTAATGIHRRRQRVIDLKRPSASAMAEGLETMGIVREKGHELAHRCGRSLTILRRLNPASGVPSTAEWADLARDLKLVLLAGGWDAGLKLDREAVAELTGIESYDDLESLITPVLTMSDSAFDRVEQVWQVRSPVDAFPHYGGLLVNSDLEKFKDVVIKVFSREVTEPSANEKFSFAYKAPEDYSEYLRDGLAYTLTLFATMADIGGLQIRGMTPQEYVNNIIRSLPDYAQSHRWIYPLQSQLPTIAEAAPEPFLDALEKSLEGQVDETLDLFHYPENNNYFFAEASPHIYVLWALEVLAWSPEYLSRVTVILGKLAAIDPAKNSNYGNRPINSLREVFLPWRPNTDANLIQRFVAIDNLIEATPDVAWTLLLLLLPRDKDNSAPTERPKLRDTSPIESEKITFGLIWKAEELVLDRILSLIQGKEERVISLLGYLGSLLPVSRERIFVVIADALEQYHIPEGSALWHRLRDYIAEQESFPDSLSESSIKRKELKQLKDLLLKHSPSDLVAQKCYLFGDIRPYIKIDAENAFEQVELEQKQALQYIYSELGVEGVLKLAKTVDNPIGLQNAFYSLEISNEDATELIFAFLGMGKNFNSLASNVSNVLRKRDDNWLKYFTDVVIPRCASSKDIAMLLAMWPNESTTWKFIKLLGEEVNESYWKHFGVLPVDSTTEELLEAIEELRRVNRSLSVLTSLYNKAKDIDSQMLLSLLDESVEELAIEESVSALISYSISDIFNVLLTREDVEHLEVARREYTYLPLIEDSVKGLSIHSLLAQNPIEYIKIIRIIFIGQNNQSREELSEEELNRIRMSYRLLKSFHTIPGDKEGVINEEFLKNWISEVRREAFESGHEDVADEFIGQLLAHSKPEPNTKVWPPLAVVAVVESVASPIIERAIEVERFNMRGVYSKMPFEGGEQERELANIYRGWASQITGIRTLKMLERMVREWEQKGAEADITAEKRKFKY